MIAILVAAVLLAQVEGKVINSSNGEPLRKATVILHSRDEDHGTNYADETDGDGHFSIDDVEPGEYGITAEHSGFFMRSSGSAGAPPPSVKVEKGQQTSRIVIKLAPLGVVTGRVLDADGDPLRGARVEALHYVYSGGKKRLERPERMEEAKSNANGEFRLFDLRPGTIYLKATDFEQRPAQGRGKIWGFYPASADESHAAPIQLREGAQIDGVDIHLRPQSLHSVRFEFPDGHVPEVAYNAALIDEGGTSATHRTSFAKTEFKFYDVPPGSYDAVLKVSNDGGKQMYALQHVEVTNADVDGGTLNVVPPAEVSGSVRVEGGAFNQFGKLHITLQSSYLLPFMGPSTVVNQDGSFALKDAVPRVYEVAIERTPGVYLKSVRMGDKMLPDRRIDLSSKLEPLVIVLGADVGTMEGSVRDAKGEPVARARVTVIASGRADLARSGFTDDKGEFKIDDIPPGDYKVFAWVDVPEGAPQDPEFRKPFEKQASDVRMPPNGHEMISLRAISDGSH